MKTKVAQIDVQQTNEAGIRDAWQAFLQRLNRELRYSPNFHGRIGVVLNLKGGMITGFEQPVQETQLVEAVKQ